MMDKQHAWGMVRQTGWIVLMLVLFLWTMLPLLWSLSSSFKTPFEVYRIPPSIIPLAPTIGPYERVIFFEGFFRYFGNSVLLAVASTGLTLVVSVLAAYSFGRFLFRFRWVLLMLFLVPRILPRAALIVPLYSIFVDLGVLDTYAVLIVTYTATAVPLATWILVGFIGKVPQELEDSARIDGAGLMKMIFAVIVPVALPGILTALVVAVVQSWKEFPFVLAFTTSAEMRTLPYQLYLMRDALGLQDWPMVNAFTIVSVAPIVGLYLIFEKRVVSGILSGSVKG